LAFSAVSSNKMAEKGAFGTSGKSFRNAVCMESQDNEPDRNALPIEPVAL
jgi:hypothetical protein